MLTNAPTKYAANRNRNEITHGLDIAYLSDMIEFTKIFDTPDLVTKYANIKMSMMYIFVTLPNPVVIS